MPPQQKCAHSTLVTGPSVYARVVGYKAYTPQQLFTAATGSRKRVRPCDGDSNDHGVNMDKSWMFPAPLVLPEDELAVDPRCPPQSFMAWLNEVDRNEVDEERGIMYVAGAPGIAECVEGDMEGWDVPREESLKGARLVDEPLITDVVAYLRAFFHGLDVRELPQRLEFMRWTAERKVKSSFKNIPSPEHVGLCSVEEGSMTRIRVRHLEESDTRSSYVHQLNLNDMLDHAISILPEDAYCLVLVVGHDLYEDEDDDFVCGRAYGGSRIAVVSHAQYQPALDVWHGVDIAEGHWWPGSHCQEFVRQEVVKMEQRGAAQGGKSIKVSQISSSYSIQRQAAKDSTTTGILSSLTEKESPPASPMEAAFAVHVNNLSKTTMSVHDLRSLYMRRITLTASHELLHCFGIDHCVYSACVMQGTASMIEDSRQPPILCQVCENKLARAVVGGKHSSWSKNNKGKRDPNWWESEEVISWKKGRHEQILRFCEERNELDLGFGSLGAWTRKYLSLIY